MENHEIKPLSNRVRIIEFDYLRVICALGIISFHYSADSKNYYFSCWYANGEWGTMFVSSFFALSGILIWMNTGVVKNLKNMTIFFWKRWKTIFPAFYISWLYFYFRMVFKQGSWFYANGAKRTMILTIIGLDGYAGGVIDNNYYLVGEWFLGAILILYFLYPIIALLFEKYRWILLCVVSSFWILHLSNYVSFPILIGKVAAPLFSFTIGIFLSQYKIYEKKFIQIISVVIWLCLVYIRIPPMQEQSNFRELSNYLSGILFLICVYFFVGCLKHLEKARLMDGLISFISSISFHMFLVQHQVVDDIFWAFGHHDRIDAYVDLFLSIMLTIGLAWAIKAISDRIIHSKVIRLIDDTILH